MLKYRLTALALKGFSCCAPTRRLYRGLGNMVGGRKRATRQMPSYYFDRVQRNLDLVRKYGPLEADDCLLELGTGWVHWEALTLRLFFDFKAVLYDVWDNRQLSALKSFLRQLQTRFQTAGFLEGSDFDRARYLISKIEGVNSFDEIYRMLGFRYLVDPIGSMESLPHNAFRVVISAGVLEHIPAPTAPRVMAKMALVSQTGGLGIHSINTADHLSAYDRTVSPKQYLMFSDRRWKIWYENKVQYINRIQRSDWLRMFEKVGFCLLEEGGSHADLPDLRIHPSYKGLSRRDIECLNLLLAVRKQDAVT
jgi:hypothetical protein